MESQVKKTNKFFVIIRWIIIIYGVLFILSHFKSCIPNIMTSTEKGELYRQVKQELIDRHIIE